jgi:hypothetical protein
MSKLYALIEAKEEEKHYEVEDRSPSSREYEDRNREDAQDYR